MERAGADRVDFDDTVHDDTVEETTRPVSEWAVPEQYRVEDAGEPSETARAAAGPPRARRFPLDRAGISLTAALLLLGSLALVAVLLTSSPDAASESALDQPRPSDLGAVTPSPSKASTAPATRKTRKVEVPDLKGSSVSEATRTLGKADLKAQTRVTESDRKAGTVIEQEPAAGDRVARESLVVLLVADGGAEQTVAEIAVPDVVGLRADRAAERARAKGLRVEIRSVRSSGEAGTVVRQKPGGGEPVARGSVVELSIAKSAATTVRVPRVTGLPLAEAKARLSASGLRWTVEQVPSSRPTGTVLGQLERPGAVVEKGTRVTLEVSSGPQLTDVPDVVGLDVVLARQQLEAAGFVVIVTDSPTADPAEDGVVLDQSPGGGTRLREGAEVTISVGLAS